MRTAVFIWAAVAALLGCSKGSTDTATATSGVTSGGTGGMGTGGSGTGGSGTGGTGGMEALDPCAPSAGQHLLISEIATQPNAIDFIEIWNPGQATLPLQYYYLSDNSAYHGIAANKAWKPAGTPETDFLIQFPAGAQIAADQVVVVELGTDLNGTLKICPHFTVRDNVMCDGKPVPKMVVPKNGGLGANVGSLLSGMGEMAMLFCWGGQRPNVSDVDYVLWDPDTTDGNTHADKTGVANYVADTPKDKQKIAPQPGINQSIGRCNADEPGEKNSGGNGILGHDETSEDFTASFKLFMVGSTSPGVKNKCP
jgi:hypothetical protein